MFSDLLVFWFLFVSGHRPDRVLVLVLVLTHCASVADPDTEVVLPGGPGLLVPGAPEVEPEAQCSCK